MDPEYLYCFHLLFLSKDLVHMAKMFLKSKHRAQILLLLTQDLISPKFLLFHLNQSYRIFRISFTKFSYLTQLLFMFFAFFQVISLLLLCPQLFDQVMASIINSFNTIFIFAHIL
jgi:hypothetical protein